MKYYIVVLLISLTLRYIIAGPVKEKGSRESKEIEEGSTSYEISDEEYDDQDSANIPCFQGILYQIVQCFKPNKGLGASNDNSDEEDSPVINLHDENRSKETVVGVFSCIIPKLLMLLECFDNTPVNRHMLNDCFEQRAFRSLAPRSEKPKSRKPL